MSEEIIEYPTGYNNAGGRHWSKIKVCDVKEEEKRDCPFCDGKGCDTCDNRGWVYSGQEWEFSCPCGSCVARSDCAENAELDCDCFEDE